MLRHKIEQHVWTLLENLDFCLEEDNDAADEAQICIDDINNDVNKIINQL